MLKLKSIISSLQDFSFMYLDSNKTEFICKDDSNLYIICHSDIEEGTRYVSLNELQAFIKSNENLFIDKFIDDTKYKRSNFNKAVDAPVDSNPVIRYSLEELDAICNNLRSGW